MSNFKTLQARHQELIHKTQTSEDIVDEAKKYIDDVKSSSSQIGAASERDQMRANLRYWASYVYERTQTYPNVDLAPSSVAQRPNLFLPVVVGVLILVLIGSIATFLLNAKPTTQVPTDQSNLLPTPSLPPPATSTPVLGVPTATPLALPTLSSEQSNIISIQLTTVKAGDEVLPVTELGGTYSNLRAGYSIHVIIQPESNDGLQFPMPAYALIGSTASAGEWSIQGKFGEGEELKRAEDYLIWVVFAPDETARQALLDSVGTGFRELPSGVVSFVQPVRVHRPGFTTVLTGVRLIYSSFLEGEGNSEVFSTKLDGTDQLRITNTSAVSELFPSLSPDGGNIVYAGRKRDENNRPLYSIEIINSDGTASQVIREPQREFTYERPLYSSDGRYIAYAMGKVSGESQTIWSIAVYDLEQDRNTILVEGNATGPRYISWVPRTHELIFNARIAGTSGFRKINVEIPNATPEEYFNGLGEELQPSVSPDALKLAYMQLDNTIGNIYVVDLANGNIQQLTQNQFAGSSPIWSPDGKTVYYQFFADGFYSIWSVTIGAEPVQITFGQDQYPFIGKINALIP